MDVIQQYAGIVEFKNLDESPNFNQKESPLQTMSDNDLLLLDMADMPSADRERAASPHEFTATDSTFERVVPYDFAFDQQPMNARYEHKSLNRSPGPGTRLSNHSTLASSQTSLFKSHLKTIKSPNEILH